ncbi:MAG TPA: PqqD family protein [Cyanobacteria bacterium UBA8803]|nr:PqqD family protein [Cyanobacteria bacterium UBA9273]HBL60479.1 PqqD family protein [Cyanobacteria bacterium UBA8803]
MISSSSRITVAKRQVSSNLGDEAVILDPKSGAYYGLNDVGAYIWNLIQQPKLVNEIRETILKEYEVNPEECDRDLMELLEQLKAQGLIEVKG